jgi:hypothetical protein
MAEILTATTPPLADVERKTPVALDRVVQKCLAEDPVRRWQHASDLHDDFAWIESDLVRRSPATTNVETSRQRRRMPRVFALAALLPSPRSHSALGGASASDPERVTRRHQPSGC